MASHKNHQSDDDKYQNSANIFIRKAPTGKKENKSEVFWENFEEYIAYYRSNPHRMASEYFGLRLHFWQQFILYCMFTNYNTIFLASRGAGKSWLCALYCIIYGVLYPQSAITIVSATKKQSGMLMAKVKELQNSSPMLAREIADIRINKDDATIILHGGSIIQSAVANDNARGIRTQVLVIDEANDVDKDIIEKVFVPMLTAERQPNYLKNKEYRHMKNLEHNHFIKLSSIGSRSSNLYEEFENYIRFISKGIDEYCVFSLPYEIPMKDNVISKKLVQKMLRESTRGIEAFQSEMSVVPYGENESSVLKFEDMNKNRKVIFPLVPISDDEFFEFKGDIRKYPFYQKKEEFETRLISYDIATASNSSGKNDLSVFTVFRLVENGDFYDKEIAYIETLSGVEMEKQIIRFKELFYDLQCDLAVIDAMGIGRVFVSQIMKRTSNPTRGVMYPAWSLRINQDKFEDIQTLPDAQQILFPVIMSGASAQQLQAQMIQRVRFNFEKKMLKLPLHEDDVIDDLQKRYKYLQLKSSHNADDNAVATRLISTFHQATKLIEEGISVQAVVSPSGGMSIDEKSGRKDRLMSMMYGVDIISLLEQDLQSNKEPFDMSKFIAISQGSNRTSSSKFGGSGGFQGFGR